MEQAPGYHGLDWQRRNTPILDLPSAIAKLREHEATYALDGSSPVAVTRFDVNRLEATMPCEDNYTFESAEVADGLVWQFWGVFDGHAGWQTSTVLRQALVTYVVREVKEFFGQSSETPSASAVDEAIKKAFVRLDDDIVLGGLKTIQDPGATRAEILADASPSYHGSMAILAIFEPSSSTLRLVSTGDSGALVAHRGAAPDASWTVGATSISHSLAANPAERERLIAEHPDEPELIAKDRVLGLPVSRAFGDHRWKWPAEAIEKAHDSMYGTAKREHYTSPPYLRADPDIVTVTIKPGDVAILGTDGLWDTLGHEMAVECLAQWVAETARRDKTGAAPLDGTAGPETADSGPIEAFKDAQNRIADAWSWGARTEDLVVEDGNAATHLIRNALGGKRREQFTTVMTALAPSADDARDDVTVQVLFFGDVLQRK